MAYGNNNAFVYLFNQTGKVVLDATTFGIDPIFGTSKLVYCKPVVDGADAVTFAAALAKIKRHITGDAVHDAAQINLQAGLLAASMFTLVDSEATLAEALAVVEAYEKKEGTFFIGAKTKGGFPNKPGALDGLELARAVFTLQQGIHDQAFTPAAFAKHRALLGGKKFNTADFFPGRVKLAADPSKTYVAKIKASMPIYYDDRGREPVRWRRLHQHAVPGRCRHRRRADQERSAGTVLLGDRAQQDDARRVGRHAAQQPGAVGRFPDR